MLQVEVVLGLLNRFGLIANVQGLEYILLKIAVGRSSVCW